MKTKRCEIFSRDGLSVKGLVSHSIKEEAVVLRYLDRQNYFFQGIEFYERGLNINYLPLTSVDLLANSYFRLSYLKKDGSSATLGTSIVGSFSFRTSDNVFHFIPQIDKAELKFDEANRPIVKIEGHFGNLARITMIRNFLLPTSIGTSCKVDVKFIALQEITLSKHLLSKDAFRFCTISSMYTPNLYDGNKLEYSEVSGGTKDFKLDKTTKRGHYIFEHCPSISSMIGVAKDKLSLGSPGTPGSCDSPSIHINSIDSQHSLLLQAYLADTLDINSDTLSTWLEWKGAPEVIYKGSEISFSYLATATEPT